MKRISKMLCLLAVLLMLPSLSLAQDPFSAACEHLILLGLETPESLSGYTMTEDFYHNEEDNLDVLDVLDVRFFQSQQQVYTLRLDALSGDFLSLFCFDFPSVPQRFYEETPAIDALIDHWDALYSDSANYSPEVFSSELLHPSLPSENDMSHRTALSCAAGMILTLTGYEADTLKTYIPYVSFDVSPMASRWYILITQDVSFQESCEVFSVVLNAGTGSLEKISRNVIHPAASD